MHLYQIWVVINFSVLGVAFVPQPLVVSLALSTAHGIFKKL